MENARSLQKERTRKKILAAAARCFEKRGYPSTQIHHITSTAGLAVGSFYVHFRDKETLSSHMLEEFNRTLAERLRKEWTGGVPGEPRKIIRKMAGIYLGHLEENKSTVRALSERFALGLSTDQLSRGVNPPAVEFLNEGLGALAGGSRAKVPVELLTHAVLAVWLRLSLQCTFDRKVSRREVEDVLVRLTEACLGVYFPKLFKGKEKSHDS